MTITRRPRFLVISASLKSDSRSSVLARLIQSRLLDATRMVDWLDLRALNLPHCNAGDCYEQPDVQEVSQLVRAADGIALAAPVYNYDLGSAAKNLVELTGRAWTEKVVGFACAAGGSGSYMAPMQLANSLMLDFRAWILPRFVYATGRDFEELEPLTPLPPILERVDVFTQELIRATEALRHD